jgi:hypothetical protein
MPETDSPVLAAIVVIPDTYAALQKTMDCLRRQTIAELIEIAFVVPSRQKIDIEEKALVCFHSWQVVETGRIKSIADGFAAGIRHAHAPVVALIEDHSFPDKKWAESLVEAHKGPWAAVGPSMRNGNPVNMLNWADFYQAYGEWYGPASSKPVRHLPGHNSSYKRAILLEFGESLEKLMESESVLHRHLKARGYELLLESGTCNSHLNFTTWKSWIPVKYYTGRQFAAIWSLNWLWPRRLVFVLASPLVPLIRLWRIQEKVKRNESIGFFIRILPVLFVGLLFEGLGHMVSYAIGDGNYQEKLMKYEFNRVDYIRPD